MSNRVFFFVPRGLTTEAPLRALKSTDPTRLTKKGHFLLQLRDAAD